MGIGCHINLVNKLRKREILDLKTEEASLFDPKVCYIHILGAVRTFMHVDLFLKMIARKESDSS